MLFMKCKSMYGGRKLLLPLELQELKKLNGPGDTLRVFTI